MDDTGTPVDADSDGHGVDGDSQAACAQPEGFTTASGDCDDADAASTAVATDADCDGVLTADDCDDTDPNAYPGAQET